MLCDELKKILVVTYTIIFETKRNTKEQNVFNQALRLRQKRQKFI